MGERHLVGAEPVPGQQQPTRQPLLEEVTSIAGGGLGDLEMKAFQVSPKMLPELGIFLDGGDEFGGCYPQSLSLNLYHRLMQPLVTADQERESAHAFAADGADLNGISVFQPDDEGDHARLRKVGMFNVAAALVQGVF